LSELLGIDQVRRDGGTQPRARLDSKVIDDYKAALAHGAQFPPVIVFYDGTDHWLADGFHRTESALQAGLHTIACEVRPGTQEDAKWFSFSANQTNGLRRTNGDKQRAVTAALQHPNATTLSDSQIAAHVGVDHVTVSNWRKKLGSTCEFHKSDLRTGRDGRTTNVANIGKGRRARKSVTTSPESTAASAAPQAPQHGASESAATDDDPGPANPVRPEPQLSPRMQRISRVAELKMSVKDRARRLDKLVERIGQPTGWLGRTLGDFRRAEALLSDVNDSLSAVLAELERQAIAVDPSNESYLQIERNLS
jgi:hypothetical protein